MLIPALVPVLVLGGSITAVEDPAAAVVDRVSRASLSEFVHSLAGLGPRPVADEAATERASALIEGRLRDVGYSVEREPFQVYLPNPDPGPDGSSWSVAERWNIVATKPGLREPDSVIELGAHFDTVAGSPGADDNGSGVATLVEVARAVADVPTARTLRFVFYGAEEVGLVGSQAHASSVAARVAAGEERFHGAFVIDMMGFGSQARGSQEFPVRIPLLLTPSDRGNWLFIAGDGASAPLARAFRRAAATYEPGFVVWGFDGLAHLHPHGRRGDHASYWDRGLRAFTVNDTAELRSPHYHLASDTPETLDYEFLLRAARSACGWALDVAVVLDSDENRSIEAASRPAPAGARD